MRPKQTTPSFDHVGICTSPSGKLGCARHWGTVNSLTPTNIPPTARAAGNPKPISGAGALCKPHAVQGATDGAPVVWAKARIALKQSHKINVDILLGRSFLPRREARDHLVRAEG